MSPDAQTQLSERRTRLSLERTFLGAERTLMAWVRTALSMISFGFAAAKLFEYLRDEHQLSVGIFRSWAPATLGLLLILIGTGALVVAVLQHWQTLRALRREGLEPRWSLALAVAGLVAALGVFALGSVVLQY